MAATPVWEADGISEEKKTAGVKDIGHILFNKQGGQWLAMGHGWSFKNYSLKYAYALYSYFCKCNSFHNFKVSTQ